MAKDLLKIIENELYSILDKIDNFNDIKETDTTLKKYICSICSHEFESRKNLNRHNIRAHGEKKFVCEGYYTKDDMVCNAKFSEKYSLQRHIKKNHIGKED